MKASILLLILLVNVALTFFFDHSPWVNFRGTLENNVGYVFWRGPLVVKDESSAIAWFDRAVALKNSSAANNLATLYQEQVPPRVSKEKLIELFRLAATDGVASAQNNLGVLLLDREPSEAAVWFQLATRSRDITVAETAQANLQLARARAARSEPKPLPRKALKNKAARAAP